MAQLSPTAIASYARAAGFSGQGLIVAVAVALAESGGNPGAYNPEAAAGTPSGSGSRGLWQVYGQAHPQYNNDTLYNPAVNAVAAYSISGGGRNWRPWSTFTSGAYLRFMPDATAGVNALGGVTGPGSVQPTPVTTASAQTQAAAAQSTGAATTQTYVQMGTGSVGTAYNLLLALAVLFAGLFLLARTRAGYVAIYYGEALILLFLFATQARFLSKTLQPLTGLGTP